VFNRLVNLSILPRYLCTPCILLHGIIIIRTSSLVTIITRSGLLELFLLKDGSSTFSCKLVLSLFKLASQILLLAFFETSAMDRC
jgi:hypothetical protein